MRRHRPILVLLTASWAFATLACEADDPADRQAALPVADGREQPQAAEGGAADVEVDVEAEDGTSLDRRGAIDAASAAVHVELHDRRLDVVDAAGTVMLSYDLADHEGEPVHAALRPGDGDDRLVVLALFRVVAHPELSATYELRYLVADGAGVSELFWFPWRLQIDARVAEVLDVAPRPVWSPDGNAVAWIEWDGQTTKLRLVGWHDGVSSNPSDAVASYTLDVPPGTQLETWSEASPGVLVGQTQDGEVVEIELPSGKLALEVPGAASAGTAARDA